MNPPPQPSSVSLSGVHCEKNPKYFSKLNVTVVNSTVTADIELLQTLKSLVQTDTDYCELLSTLKNSLFRRWVQSALKNSNFMENCPVPAGHYYLNSWHVDMGLVPAYLLSGDYRLSALVYYGKYRTRRQLFLVHCIGKPYQSVYHHDMNYCALIKGSQESIYRRWYTSMLKVGNFATSCPIKQGYYYLHGWTLDANYVPSFLYLGDYRIRGSFFYGRFKKQVDHPLLECSVEADRSIKFIAGESLFNREYFENFSFSIRNDQVFLDMYLRKHLLRGWRARLDFRTRVGNSKSFQSLFSTNVDVCHIVNAARISLFGKWYKNLLEYGNFLRQCPLAVRGASGSYRLETYNFIGGYKGKDEDFRGFKAHFDIQLRLANAKNFQSMFNQKNDVCAVTSGVKNSLFKTWFKDMTKDSNFMYNCPVEVGHYYLRNWRMGSSMTHKFLIPGEYRAKVSFFYGKYATKSYEEALNLTIDAILSN
ncbi:hypothetical protein M5D96_009218 [Drosophila gunungcola]|uniref:Uncharacterized protein n=1 Tax=Drosophila gunungcola TaxID=103775 RepID=A0A9P9YJG5_9MUSC|nr:hypothetical protein M5D96_009218 [Drosophila gunungcola]